MTHDRVVDTSYLFAREGYPDGIPSLRDVVSAALGKAIQEEAHDSVTDAQVCTYIRREDKKRQSSLRCFMDGKLLALAVTLFGQTALNIDMTLKLIFVDSRCLSSFDPFVGRGIILFFIVFFYNLPS